jgi:hypothetical protein
MPVLTRFQTLRPSQWISGDAVMQSGLPLYPDEKLSELADKLAAASDQESYNALIANYSKTHEAEIVKDVNALGPIVRALYDWFNFVARPIKSQRLNAFLKTLKASDLPDITDDWRRFADSLVLAIEANLLSKNFCIDLQLLIRICYLLRRFIQKTDGKLQLTADVTDGLIAELLARSIVLPPRVLFDRCRRKCSEPNSMILPTPDRELGSSKVMCECKCDESCQRPVSHCICIRPYIGDLFLIREELARYEAGDIADIENILAGEAKLRTHRSLQRSEQSLETENQTTTADERDHQATEKFSLQSEVKNTIDEKLNFDAGVTATLKYGGSITLTPHANVSGGYSKNESENLARSYAKDVVDRAVTKVEEKTRTLQVTKTTREIEERNRHSIDNTQQGAAHRAGLYYWVNKITHAQVMNYGRHMMFDLIVPEPGAIFKLLYSKKKAKDNELVAPQKPDITPTSIQRNTYGTLLAQYGIASTEELEPPDPTICVQLAFSQNMGNPDDNKTMGFSSNEFKSPDLAKGYNATALDYDIRCSIAHPKSTDTDDQVAVSVNVGDMCLFTNSMNEYLSSGGLSNHDWFSSGHRPMKGEEGNITVAVAGFSSLALALSGTISISAQLTQERFEKWQVSIFNTIMADYNRRLEDYNAANGTQADLFQIKGRNPFLNREIERNELKRHVIPILMCNYFNGLGSMMEHVAPCGYPEMDLAKLERDAPVIQFFEQVFEWEYITYLFYHSMWARKCKWPELIDEDSGDPLFDKFLMSGAARVQVPVRQGMEDVFTWFLATGQIWGATGKPPLPGETDYVSMIQELKEASQGDYDDRPGLIDATTGDPVLTLTESTYYWDSINGIPNASAIENDRDREILLNYQVHRVVDVVQANAADPTTWKITIDVPYPEASASNLKHAVGAVFVGAPWEVVTPTELVYLRNPTDTLPVYPLN